MASSGMTRKDMAQMFKKIGWKRKEEVAPPPSSQPAVSTFIYSDDCFGLLDNWCHRIQAPGKVSSPGGSGLRTIPPPPRAFTHIHRQKIGSTPRKFSLGVTISETVGL